MISLTSDLREEFLAAAPGRVRFDEPMRLHTTFHIGGPAQIWAEPVDAQELRHLLQIAQGAALSITLVSGGANLLVRDEGIPGLVIHLGAPGFQGVGAHLKMSSSRKRGSDSRWSLPSTPIEGGNDKDVLRVGAGLPLEWLIRWAKEEGLSGVEFLAGVPGRLGGAVRMNAGTHDDEGNNHSISDVIRSVTVMELDGQIRTIPREEIGFGYRTSDLPGRIILESELLLTSDDPERIAQRVKRLWEFKRKTQDWTAPSVGCIFKNPTQTSLPAAHSAGRLIDQAGLKGFRIGGAAISSIHANFMMNVRQARAADVFGLIEEARSRVRRRSGIQLELEVQVLPERPVMVSVSNHDRR